MPRQTRASRSRSRSQRSTASARPAAAARPAPLATPTADAETVADAPMAAQPVAAAAAPRRTTARTGAATARQPRGIVTDYNYVISELKQIFILTIVVLVILIALYFVIG